MNKVYDGAMRTLITLLLLLIMSVAAQAQDGNAAIADDPSRETDVSEDNYRRFMELRDLRVERPAFPSATLNQPAAPQKLTALPEAAQRHLRDQLRSIILESPPWTPAAMEQSYAYVPSQGARRNPALQNDEAEAWEELVAAYHAREATQFAAAQANQDAFTEARADGTGAGTAPGGPPAATGAPDRDASDRNTGSAGGGAAAGTQDSAANAARQQAAARQQELERLLDQPAPPSPTGSARREDTGVSQSAAAFLAERGYQTSEAEAPEREAPDDTDRVDNRWQTAPSESAKPRRVTVPSRPPAAPTGAQADREEAAERERERERAEALASPGNEATDPAADDEP